MTAKKKPTPETRSRWGAHLTPVYASKSLSRDAVKTGAPVNEARGIVEYVFTHQEEYDFNRQQRMAP